jgi:hypothetical protein
MGLFARIANVSAQRAQTVHDVHISALASVSDLHRLLLADELQYTETMSDQPTKKLLIKKNVLRRLTTKDLTDARGGNNAQDRMVTSKLSGNCGINPG